MTANKLILATVITTLLSACGAATPAYQAPLPGDGTYGSSLGTDPYGAGDPYAAGNVVQGADPTSLPAGTPGVASPTAGFTLKGLIAAMDGKPVAGAKVSIGSQTTLSLDNGTFEITGVTDTQVWVDVTKDGFESITRFNVTFTAATPLADKEFKLAAAGEGASAGDGSGNTNTGSNPAKTGFTLESTFSGPAWTSVAAMVVDGDTVYVLGVIDNKWWFDRAAVVAYSARTGEETTRYNNGLFSKIPKAADGLQVDGGQVSVSDGSNRYAFGSDGKYLKKTSGSRFPAIKEATDGDRKISYGLKSSTKVTVKKGSTTTDFALPEIGAARALGLDGNGKIIVLDDGKKGIAQYSFSE